MSRGVGPSKIFAREQGHGRDWSKLTINGVPIPEAMHALTPYEMTDQGAAEERAKVIAKNGREDTGPRIELTRDQDDKRVDKYADDLEYGGLVTNPDPLKVMMDKHLPKGHRGLWLGEEKMKQSGLLRGVIEYKPVLIKNAETWQFERVKQNGMLLASVPEDLARKAEAYYIDQARQKERSTQEKVHEQSDRILGDGRMRRLAKQQTGVLETLQVDDGERDGLDFVVEHPELLERDEMAHEQG